MDGTGSTEADDVSFKALDHRVHGDDPEENGMPGDTEGTEEDRRGTEFGQTGEAGSHSSEVNRPNLLDQNHGGTRVRSGVTAGIREIRGQRL